MELIATDCLKTWQAAYSLCRISLCWREHCVCHAAVQGASSVVAVLLVKVPVSIVRLPHAVNCGVTRTVLIKSHVYVFCVVVD